MPRKRSLEPTEHQIQAAFIEWVKLHEKIEPGLKLSFAVPNGGKRNVITATLIKNEGVKRGVPDWLCPVNVLCTADGSRYYGLAIEFKARLGKISPEQNEYCNLLIEEGWYVRICRSTQEAIDVVKFYFDMK